ncbi:hypothetical protein ABZ901_07115 [Actinacidiphila alni]|uniref:DUF2269 family protein n=1 Tax=Actinacidiphila alni TaxID=380248 RepID=UPI0033E761FB
MTKFLLALHVLAAIVAIGPVTVAASMFPAAARHADAATASGTATVRTLHRICRVYTGVALAVPILGLVTAQSLGVLGSGWLIAAMVLTAVAAAVLGLLVLPGQEVIVESFDAPDARPVPREVTVRLAMYTGLFNLLWATVTVLMISRPGSTTGV